MAKHFTAEFKLEAAKLVVDHGYTFVKAAEAVNVSHSALTRWVNKLRLERQGKTPAGLPLTPEQLELRGFAPITPDSSTLLFRSAGVADIPAANGNLTHCADAIRCNARTPSLRIPMIPVSDSGDFDRVSRAGYFLL